MTMLRLNSEAVPKSELNFTWNADLVWFDGPLISLFKKEADDFIVFWVDADRHRHRWVATPVDRTMLEGYLKGDTSLNEIIANAKMLYTFDSTQSGQRRNFGVLDPKNLPDAYRPEADSYLYRDIATQAAIDLADVTPKKYRIGLDGELYIDDIATVPKLFQQLYSFHYGLGNLDSAAVKDLLTKYVKKWKGGINAVNIFTGMRSVMPSIHRAKVVNIAYASPGHIDLELLRDFAQKIDADCERIVASAAFQRAENLYGEVYSYFRSEGISGFDSERRIHAANLTRRQVEVLKAYVDRYFAMLNWADLRQKFSILELDPLSELRLILAYYRRLRSLRRYVVAEKIRLS